MKKENIYPNSYCPISKKQKNVPLSEASFLLNLLALILSLVGLVFIKFVLKLSALYALGIFSCMLAVIALGWEYIYRKKNFTECMLKKQQKIVWSRVFFKLSGLGFIWLVMAWLYWLLPLYDDKLFVEYFEVLKKYWWIGVVLSLGYMTLADAYVKHPDDAYCQLGRWLFGKHENINKAEMIELWRGWGVKFFYLALMLPYLLHRIDWFMNADFALIFEHPYSVFSYFNQFVFLLDLSYAAVGYVMTFKIFNTHIRSSEPTLLGWFAALACYWPFWGVLFGQYFFRYNTGINWVDVWQNTGIWFVLWMVLILLCELIYSLATIAMGIRFSNLTYRGLVTSGPYRFTKHPAYVFKCISWWLISMPFMVWAQDWELAVKSCMLLLAVNALYYIRAKTEENHLSHYPEYVQYALAMNEKSIFAGLAKYLPFLKYKAPKM